MDISEILELETLYSFHGVHDTEFKLGSLVFKAVEDPADGYGSYLDSVTIINTHSIFFKEPLINLYYRSPDSLGVAVELFDESGHLWLSIGTNHDDNYYPSFMFNYTPRKDVVNFSKPIYNLDPQLLHPEKLI